MAYKNNKMSILNLKAWIGQQCNLKYEENNSDAHLSNKKKTNNTKHRAYPGYMLSVYDQIIFNVRRERLSNTLGYWGKTSSLWVMVGVSSSWAPLILSLGKGSVGHWENRKFWKRGVELLKEGKKKCREKNPLPSDYITRQEICRAVTVYAKVTWIQASECTYTLLRDINMQIGLPKTVWDHTVSHQDIF